MKCTVFFIALFILYIDSYSQVSKTYSGAFENGTATYQYYENDKYERVFNGPFSYKSSTVTVTGSYKENLKSGVWKATRNVSEFGETYTDVATGNFVDGKLVGLSSYTRTSLKTKQVVAKSNQNFIDNVAVGKFKFWADYGKNKFDIEYSLNKNGFIDGTYTVKFSVDGTPYEHIAKYTDGYLFWEVYRDLATGTIIRTIDRKNLIDKIVTNYDSVTMVSIIPRISFLKGSPLPKSETNLQSYETTSKTKTDSIVFISMPIKHTKNTLSESYDSHWSILTSINFWESGDCEYCGSKQNPIYFFTKGSQAVSLNVIKQVFVDTDLYDEIKKKEALNDLRKAMLDIIDWTTISGLTISATPISKSHSIGYFRYTKGLQNGQDLLMLKNCTRIILSKETIKTDLGGGPSYEFGLDPVYDLTNQQAAELATILGLKVATSDQQKSAGKPSTGTHYFVKD